MQERDPGVRAHVLVSLAALATFARAVPYPLQLGWDDRRFLVDNPDVQHVSWQALRSIVGGVHFEAYHPFHLLSYWLDVPWFGARGPALHAVSLGLWVLATNLLLRVLADLGCRPFGALIGCLACALHPAQVEAVSWATGRKDVLAMIFACCCVLCHLRSGSVLDRYAWLTRLAYLMAVLSKTTALPLPAVLVLIDLALGRRDLRQAVLQQLPSLGLGAGVSAFVIGLWRAQQMIQDPGSASAGSWIGRVAATFGHQLATALWPGAVSPMYSTHAVASPSGWAVLSCSVLLLGAWLLVSVRATRLWLALGTFVLLMLPVCNAIPMYFPYQDRYLSLPLLGLALGLGAALDGLRARLRGFSLALGVSVVIALALRTAQYEGEWQSELRLWGHAVRAQPDAYYAFMKLGEVRRDRGAFDGAIRAYQQALQLEPLRKLGHAALFQAVALRDERVRKLLPSRAERYTREYYERLGDPEALRALGARLLEAGYLRAPELPAERALALQPFPDQALEHAAAAQFAQGRPGLALLYLRHMREPSRRPDLLRMAEHAREQMRAAPML